jgi:hypothetical protein
MCDICEYRTSMPGMEVCAWCYPHLTHQEAPEQFFHERPGYEHNGFERTSFEHTGYERPTFLSSLNTFRD